MNNRCPTEIYIGENITFFFPFRNARYILHIFFNVINWFLFFHDVMQNHQIVMLGYTLKPEAIDGAFQNNRVNRRFSF